MRKLLLALAISGLATTAAAQTAPAPDATILPEINVQGRATPEAVRDFVGRVAAPSPGRSLAQWRGPICPGVINLERQAAQAILDRVSRTAAELGLRTGDPGCTSNLVVVFVEDGRETAQSLNRANPKLFRQNITGWDRGQAAFDAFLSEQRPVRWWSLSIPTDPDTGERAVRAPGDIAGGYVDKDIAEMLGCSPGDCAIGAAPTVRRRAGAARVNAAVVETLFKVIVIVDIDLIGSVNTTQLADYVSMIALAQIDASADTTGFDTVLNLFSGSVPAGLSDWDRSYLAALYAPRAQRRSASAQATAVIDVMTRGELIARRQP
ncbi:hypothetical protein [Brevundimonas guildfordensis]|uniref:DUF2927 domain-containing protein n=1 Tax=Brevundimonas guildfordensis TaxID=2762241 RepID=A0ABR8R173_9CAUL|nr:hypothetical protein [Brevundimonas guildfordensis]MBD7941523.1 hypothetical protein [Brevundimonas guildfordensis]